MVNKTIIINSKAFDKNGVFLLVCINVVFLTAFILSAISIYFNMIDNPCTIIAMCLFVTIVEVQLLAKLYRSMKMEKWKATKGEK